MPSDLHSDVPFSSRSKGPISATLEISRRKIFIAGFKIVYIDDSGAESYLREDVEVKGIGFKILHHLVVVRESLGLAKSEKQW